MKYLVTDVYEWPEGFDVTDCNDTPTGLALVFDDYAVALRVAGYSEDRVITIKPAPKNLPGVNRH